MRIFIENAGEISVKLKALQITSGWKGCNKMRFKISYYMYLRPSKLFKWFYHLFVAMKFFYSTIVLRDSKHFRSYVAILEDTLCFLIWFLEFNDNKLDEDTEQKYKQFYRFVGFCVYLFSCSAIIINYSLIIGHYWGCSLLFDCLICTQVFE